MATDSNYASSTRPVAPAATGRGENRPGAAFGPSTSQQSRNLYGNSENDRSPHPSTSQGPTLSSILQPRRSVTPDRACGTPVHMGGTPDRRMFGTPDRPIGDTSDRPMFGTPNRRIGGTPDRPIGDTPDRPMFGTPDRRMFGTPDRPIDGTPDRRMFGTPDRPIDGTPDRPIDDTPDRRIGGTPNRRIGGTPNRRIGGTPDRPIGGTPDRPIGATPVHVGGTPNRRMGGTRPRAPPCMRSSAPQSLVLRCLTFFLTLITVVALIAVAYFQIGMLLDTYNVGKIGREFYEMHYPAVAEMEDPPAPLMLDVQT